MGKFWEATKYKGFCASLKSCYSDPEEFTAVLGLVETCRGFSMNKEIGT